MWADDTDGGRDSRMLVVMVVVRVGSQKKEAHAKNKRASWVLQDVQTGRRRAAGKYFSSFTEDLSGASVVRGKEPGWVGRPSVPVDGLGS